jgi:hypothetical protein
MSKKTPVQIVRQITLIVLLISAITQLTTILLMMLGIDNHPLMVVHKTNGLFLFAFILTHIIVFRKNLKFYLFPPQKGSPRK